MDTFVDCLGIDLVMVDKLVLGHMEVVHRDLHKVVDHTLVLEDHTDLDFRWKKCLLI